MIWILLTTCCIFSILIALASTLAAGAADQYMLQELSAFLKSETQSQ